jgi:3-hydroxyisobutyrate dehydrogenase/2-hydroxy-3-oxopropionate reductase
MGAPIAKRLAAAGYRVVAYDLDPARIAVVVEAGVTPAESAAACAASAHVLLTSLPRPSDVESVMSGPDGALAAMRAGTIWVDLSTNSGTLIRKLADAAPAGVKVVDAPVTGAVDGARAGKLTVFIGGDSDAIDRVEPILGHLGKTIRCGVLGTGNVVKLVTNQLWFIHAAAIGEGFAVGMANGVNLETLWYAIKESVGDSFVARHDAPSIFAGHYDPSFTLDLCVKDLGLTAELAHNVGTDLPMTEAATGAFTRAIERYGPGAGELHVARRIEDDARLSYRLVGDWVSHWEK